MVKCDLCGQKIEMTFLNKIIGTIVKKDGKKKNICSDCQKKHGTNLKNVL
jgi:hypothetical protein